MCTRLEQAAQFMHMNGFTCFDIKCLERMSQYSTILSALYTWQHCACSMNATYEHRATHRAAHANTQSPRQAATSRSTICQLAATRLLFVHQLLE